jgi:hypothetical protein
MAASTLYLSVPSGDKAGGLESMRQLVDADIPQGCRAALAPMRNYCGRTTDFGYSICQHESAEGVDVPSDAILIVGDISSIESHRELRQVD